jgi:hypothetical protein
MKKDKKNKGVVSKANKPTRSIKKDKGTCHHCDKEYLATMKEKMLNKAFTSGTKEK